MSVLEQTANETPAGSVLRSVFGRWIALLLVAGCMALAVVLTSHALRVPSPLPGAQLLTSAQCAFQPHPSGPWRACLLPDYWDRTRPDYGGDAWYRLPLPPLTARPDLHGLLLEHVSMNAEVYVNNRLVGSGGNLRGEVARNWNRMLYFTVPTPVLHKNGNTMLVHVVGYANGSSGLGPVQWGDAARMESMVQTVAQRRDAVTLMSLGVALAFGFIFAFLWWRTKESMYGFFAGGLLIGAVFIADAWWLYPPLSRGWWERLAHLSIGWSQTFFFLFMVRLSDIRAPWMERLAWWNGWAGIAALTLAPDANLLPVASLWEGLTLIWDAALLLCFARGWLRNGDWDALYYVACLIAVFAAYLHDWIPWVSGRGVAAPYVFYLGPVGFMLAMSFLLVRRMLDNYQMQQEFARRMQASLAAQKRQLDHQHERLLRAERLAAARDEHSRISRDLHDGVGACLVQASALASDHRIRDALEQAMDELRMLMDSADADADFHAMLGMMRQRLSDRLQRNGVRLDWKIEERLAWLPPDTQSAMHLIRIVQEALANALKHASPKTITLRVTADRVEIADDGCCMRATASPAGRGLKNMRWRAGQIGAELAIHSDDAGTTITVTRSNL